MSNSVNTGCDINFFPEGTIIQGNIILDKEVVIEGQIHGDIISKSIVRIKSKGYVTGDICCNNFFCEGIVEGNVKVSNCSELNNRAVIKGSMECASLITNFDCIIAKGLRLKK